VVGIKIFFAALDFLISSSIILSDGKFVIAKSALKCLLIQRPDDDGRLNDKEAARIRMCTMCSKCV
jgi:hypothetical protein